MFYNRKFLLRYVKFSLMKGFVLNIHLELDYMAWKLLKHTKNRKETLKQREVIFMGTLKVKIN